MLQFPQALSQLQELRKRLKTRYCCRITAALLLRYCCVTAALLMLYCYWANDSRHVSYKNVGIIQHFRMEAVEEREETVEEREEGGPLRLWPGAVVCMWSLWRASCSSHMRHYCSEWTLFSCSLPVPKP
jgi:hypothetical protein